MKSLGFYSFLEVCHRMEDDGAADTGYRFIAKQQAVCAMV